VACGPDAKNRHADSIENGINELVPFLTLRQVVRFIVKLHDEDEAKRSVYENEIDVP
jgi:hypothetical protein